MATYKGVGYDTSGAKVRTGTSSDDISFDSLITATDGVNVTAVGLTVGAGGAAVTGGTTTDTLTVTNDASVGGDLTVSGDIISRGAVDLVIQDNFIDLNFANSTTTAESGGLTIQMNRNSGFTAGTITTFVAGVAGVSNPTFTYTDAGSSSLLAAGDVVVIDGADEDSNNGLYVVNGVNQASFPQVVTIKGVGTAATNGATPWAQTQFTADTGDTATGFKTDIFIQLVADGSANFTDSGGSTFAKGTFLTAFHANATESNFTADGGYSTVESTLQSAYNGGNTIALTNGNNLDVNAPGSGSAAISLQANAASDFVVTGADLSLGTSSSGELDLTSAGLIDINAGANLDVDVTGSVDILASTTFSIDGTGASNVTATSGNLTLSTATSGDVDISAVGDVDIDGVNIQADATAALSLQSAVSSDITMATNQASTQTLTIAASNANGSNVAKIDMDADGDIDITAGATLDIDAVAAEVTATGGLTAALSGAASSITSTSQDLTIATATSGELKLDAVALLNIDAGANLDVDVTGTVDILASSTFSIDGTGASNVSAASGNLTLSTTTSGDVDISAAGDVDIDGINVQADATGALSLQGATDSDLTMAANTGSTQTLTIAASNANGSNVANIDVDADGAIAIDSVGATTIGAAANSNITIAAGTTTAHTGEIQIISAFPQLVKRVKADASGLTAGDVVFFNHDGTDGLVADKADADEIGKSRFGGVALETKGAGQETLIALFGAVKVVTCVDTISLASDRGNPVFVSTTPGQVSKTAPTGAGDVVYQVGICLGGSGTSWEVLLQPQFIMEIG